MGVLGSCMGDLHLDRTPYATDVDIILWIMFIILIIVIIWLHNKNKTTFFCV